MIYDFPEVGLYTQLQTLILWIDGQIITQFLKAQLLENLEDWLSFLGLFIFFFALVFGKVKQTSNSL